MVALQLVGVGVALSVPRASVSAAWGTGGQLRGEVAAGLDQLARAGGFVEHHRHLGRAEVQRAQAQAAAITLGWPACAADTSTVGPWLSSR